MPEVYLDNAATTRVHPEAAQAALDAMLRDYGNPSSLHRKGLEAQLLVDRARAELAAMLGCEPGELVFTSGGTEANNLAIQGAVRAHRRRGRTVVVSAGEHSSVLEPLGELERLGEIRLKKIDLLPDGHADAEGLIDAVDEDTILLSCMLVNSEVGAVAPLARIAKAAKRRQPRLLAHCDAVQAFGKLPVQPAKLGADLLSVSAHKLHAPKGCGALVVRKGTRILPLLYGGGQEGGLRPGTESPPLIAAFACAARIAGKDMEQNLEIVTKLREYFVNKAGKIPQLCINSPAEAAPYICNLSLPGWRSETLLHHLAGQGVFVSSGSACAKGAASHVLRSMGLPAPRVDGALRISFCADNTVEEVDRFFEALESGIETIMGPGANRPERSDGR